MKPCMAGENKDFKFSNELRNENHCCYGKGTLKSATQKRRHKNWSR